ncbi:MAG: hypothetical protein OHK0053_21250 [Microscillaceae bacterium]
MVLIPAVSALLAQHCLGKAPKQLNLLLHGNPSRDFFFEWPDSLLKQKVSIAAFFLQTHEVSNAQWRRFYAHQLQKFGPEAALAFLPDTTVWQQDFPEAFLSPMMYYYYSHPAFDHYPVVGVSWEQALAYCAWHTDMHHQEGKSPGAAFRLPTQAEWEYAARAGNVEGEYPWPGKTLSEGKLHKPFLDNFGAILDKEGIRVKDFIDDGFAFTNPPQSFPPNGFGLYDMGGNVAEWVQDDFLAEAQSTWRLCKGGSWAWGPGYLQTGVSLAFPSQARNSCLGFRVARSSIE